MLADTDPLFYSHKTEPVPAHPELSNFGPRIRSSEDLPFLCELNLELANIWRVTRKFCLLANLGAQTQTLIQPATIYGTMVSVMYRLLSMHFAIGSLEECIRLGLISFTHHIFLQWKDICSPLHSFARNYREHLESTKPENSVSPHLMLWLWMIAAVSTFRVSAEPWLEDRLQTQLERCNIRSWADLQSVLKSFLWVSVLDEERGKQTYAWLKLRSDI